VTGSLRLMTLPSATSPQLCLRGPADGSIFTIEDLTDEEIAVIPPMRFVAAVHHGALCCGDEYEAAESHGDGACDCLPPTRGLYLLDLARSIKDGNQWVYVYESEVITDGQAHG
jgi:hypothetical protein